jgi:hypothetical protein
VSVNENSIANPKVSFYGGYLSSNTYVSSQFNSTQPSLFFIPLGPDILLLQFVSSSLVIELDETHKIPKKATFSGVILPKDLEAPLQKLIDNYYCKQKFILDPKIKDILGYPDLSVADPNFQDYTGVKTCDAISVAFEFELVPIQPINAINPNPQNPPFPCPPPQDPTTPLPPLRAQQPQGAPGVGAVPGARRPEGAGVAARGVGARGPDAVPPAQDVAAARGAGRRGTLPR